MRQGRVEVRVIAVVRVEDRRLIAGRVIVVLGSHCGRVWYRNVPKTRDALFLQPLWVFRNQNLRLTRVGVSPLSDRRYRA